MSTRQLSPVGTPTTPTMSFTPVRSGLLQRKCACGGTTGLSGECEDCRKKGVGKLQRHTATQPSTFNPQPSEMPPIVHEVLRSPGQPLDPATRAFMEPRFGHDFSHVRVHTDVNAAASARAVSALAYTVGRDVVFSSGQYSPATRRGKELLAHELTHVAQQRGIAGAPTDIAPEKSVHENEAGEVSRQLFSSPQPIPKLTPARSAVQRYQIEGPWNWNDPVHETITEEALRRAGLLKLGEDFNDPVVWEYIRGVLWNDDPEGQLFDSRKTKTNNYSSGAA